MSYVLILILIAVHILHLHNLIENKTSKVCFCTANNFILHQSKDIHCCQALSISQCLNLSLSLRDRDRADTIITFHTTPQQTF